ncbi:MAG: urease accessory protein UreD [Gammaproteobacteria bacterium]|nr:urease accessory protein UreD [Gammaproteobacteria bacterium]
MASPGGCTAETACIWRGQLDLGFARQGERTALVERRAHMPLAIQRPFYPEGPQICHVLVLHPPGGMVGGDRLEIDLDLKLGAQALLTTPSAGKWYRSARRQALQQIHARLADDAHLEWLPQETIVFDGAYVRQSQHVELAPRATWLGWDITRFGRSARNERFLTGEWRNFTEVWRDGRPLWIDRQRIAGGDRLFDATYGLAGQPVVGSLVWLGQPVVAAVIEAARAAWRASPRSGEAGVTRLTQGMLCRYRGPSSAEARQWFGEVWDLLRQTFRARPACSPRIWNT